MTVDQTNFENSADVSRAMTPVIPSRNAIVFPGRTVPLNIGRTKSVAALEKAIETDSQILVIAQSHPQSQPVDVEEGQTGTAPAPNNSVTSGELHRVGTLCKIDRVRGGGTQGNYQILLTGLSRVQVVNFQDEPFIAAGYELQPDVDDADEPTKVMLIESVRTLAKDILSLVPADTKPLADLIDGIDDLALLLHLSAEHMDIPLAKKQEILELLSLRERALLILDLMAQQREALRLQGTIREKLSTRIGKAQREQMLREHLRTIKEELGDSDESGPGGETFLDRIESAKMPEAARKIAREEAKRLESMGSSSPESHIIRSYIEFLLSMPWSSATEDHFELEQARGILDEDHYGLDKIKRRIIQHLAVMKLMKQMKGSILLLVGPPGVGKTSLGQSIARALGRKFARVALGGVRDDSEIRGHRRTYIGAMPGRIVQTIKRSGVNNPVLLLDEVDKLGRGYTGDPAAALLEVLDPEQNATFTDHYLDTEFDLSKVFFIATANSIDSIPGPLLDRMEVIEVAGYTSAEKLRIAKRHLIPKQIAEHGMNSDQVAFSDELLLRLISSYTREAGVRELQRSIAALCRVATEKVLAENATLPVQIDRTILEDALGPEKYVHEVAERLVPPGVVTGLAWTPVGGDILFIEATLMPGTSNLTLTGQLGDVMKESAQIALSLVRANLPTFVPGFVYEKKDVHIHVPAGAIPKDGPSAGIAMLTTIASLFSGRSVSPKLAMTGEITLRGAVMPVGGIKEKLIAAHRAGVERVILPRRNEKDLRDVPDDVKQQLKIELVDTAQDVLRVALGLTVTASPIIPPVSISMPHRPGEHHHCR